MSETKYNIAIVDDEQEILSVLKEYMEKNLGHSVDTYQNPLTILDNYVADKYDIIFSDINMPQMYGLDLLEKIIEINPKQKMCIMTAFSTLEKVLVAHKRGACSYIMKPIQLSEIDKIINQ